MTIRKSNPYLSLVNSYLIDSPQPSSISYWWNLGSLLGMCLVIQIASGIFLAMHYSSNIELAFNSVEHIMRDVNAGWLIRYIHANGASFFFICMYLHIGKALYYGSYKSPRALLWSIGVIIFILTIATAFMGYINNNSSPKSIYINNQNNKILSLTNKNILFKERYMSNKNKIGYIFKRYYSTENILNKKYIKQQDLNKPEDIFKELNLLPEIWWNDLHKINIKENIRNELKNKSGIYIIINNITKNYYIGSAHTNNLYNRLYAHVYNVESNKGSKIVHRAIKKDGINNFTFAILEFYPYEVNRYNNEELFALETSYISLLLPAYNIMTEAGQFFGYKNKEINLNNKINLIKLSLKEERLNILKDIKSKHYNLWNINNKNLLSNIAKNRPYSYWSTKGIENIKKGSSKEIYLKLSIDNHNLCKFKSINQTSHYLCCSTKTIQRALHLGFIYIPNIFIPLLNQSHIDNHNSLIEYIDNSKLHLYKYKKINSKKYIKIRAGLSLYSNYTKIYISSCLARLKSN